MKIKNALAVFVFAVLIAACQQEAATQPLESKTTNTEQQNSSTAPTEATNEAQSTEKAMPSTKIALMKTTLGDIKIELNAEKAPISVANFIAYAEAGHYNGTLFHRVIPGFMIQGGGFEPGMEQKQTKAPIQNEANNGLSNENYSIAMARTSAPHSATSQFFINVTDNSRLDFTSESGPGWGYAVFGKVIEGQDIVNAIEVVETGRVGPFGDVPREDVIIESVTIAD